MTSLFGEGEKLFPDVVQSLKDRLPKAVANACSSCGNTVNLNQDEENVDEICKGHSLLSQDGACFTTQIWEAIDFLVQDHLYPMPSTTVHHHFESQPTLSANTLVDEVNFDLNLQSGVVDDLMKDVKMQQMEG